MSAAIKGYVVRGLYKGRHMGISDLHGSSAGLREPHPFAALDYAAERAIELRRFDWSDVAIFRVLDDGREERLPSYEEALGALSILRDEVQFAQDYKRGGGMSCGGPPLLWTCPPSALKELMRLADGASVGDPLAALESAERRLLEAGGWTLAEPDEYGGERWNHEEAGKEARSTAIVIARRMAEIERRRLAAKGGA